MPSEQPQTHDDYAVLLRQGGNGHMPLVGNEVAWSGQERWNKKPLLVALGVLALVLLAWRML